MAGGKRPFEFPSPAGDDRAFLSSLRDLIKLFGLSNPAMNGRAMFRGIRPIILRSSSDWMRNDYPPSLSLTTAQNRQRFQFRGLVMRKTMMDRLLPPDYRHAQAGNMNKAALILASPLIFVLMYIASVGPAWALVRHGYISKSAFEKAYLLLGPLENHCPGDLLWRYENWWAPKLES
jgi:hypothetical protein